MIGDKIMRVNILKKKLARISSPQSNLFLLPKIKKIHLMNQIILQATNLPKNHQVIPNKLLHMKKILMSNIPKNQKNLNYMLSLKIILIRKKSSVNSIKTFQIVIAVKV
jgi:hypothetical protein